MMEGGSAHKSGEIFPGDVIYSIDDVSILGWEMSRVCTVWKDLLLWRLVVCSLGQIACCECFSSGLA